MYICQNGKLYTQLSDEKIVGVEIYSDKILQIDGTETTLDEEYLILTKREVQCKFHIEDEPYIFPIEVEEMVVPKKVVEKNDTVGKTKGTRTRK